MTGGKRVTTFWERVDEAGSCWLWLGRTNRYGYGELRVPGSGGRIQLAHRRAYEELVGPIPEGLVIDHLCRVRRCVNPAHMEPVTNRENLMRGASFSAVHARKTHCVNGHPFDQANTYWFKGARQCRTCNRRAALAYYRRKRAEADS